MIAQERLWLNKDQTKVVKQGDPEAAFLLAGKGAEIPKEFESMVSSSTETKEQPKPENKEHKEIKTNKGKPAKEIKFGGDK